MHPELPTAADVGVGSGGVSIASERAHPNAATNKMAMTARRASAERLARASICTPDALERREAASKREVVLLKVLITGAKSRTAGIIADGLAARHQVVLTDLVGGGGATACELGHDAATDQLVAGVDAIVHTGYEAQEADVAQLIDYHTRCTYNLLFAASQAGVSRVVHISTLRLFDGYEENLTVTEKWRSLPPADDPQLLACHLGEIVCKEFARDRLIQTVNLRLGFPIVDGGPGAASDSGETAAVDAETVVAAVAAALECDAEQWQDVHVQSAVPNQRFLLHAATNLLKLQAAGGAGGRR